uniref:NADH:ubiquinone reductase (H(+)-translocating) n=1 Tax=Echinoderes svetlanae TaxID=1912903 RepID=A0A1I9VTV2_9BILA|nr:NADH dehydrogenase subunit 5 [Echinoderes svetlanae]APA17425.1 NADH dehydrogenase subunit 5 [Echinoderes svetlanae]
MSLISLMLGIYMMLFLVMDNFLDYDYFMKSLSISSFSITLDNLSFGYGFVVMFISGSVFLFSLNYMDGDFMSLRFGWMVIFFISSMLMVVYSGSLMHLFIGWDLLGISSFLLVIYFENSSSASAGYFTAIVNRLGDSGFVILFCYFICMNIISGDFIFLMDVEGLSLYLILVGLFFLAGFTKSAQFPFCAWLPAAMAAPTPVSALVHSSTLVTAGVFLLVRYSYFFMGNLFWQEVFMFISGLTSVLAGFCASVEQDMKKIVALSTLSQLGFMCYSISIGAPEIGALHMMVHALFKASMFICAGGLIHSIGGGQDLRFFGGICSGGGLLSVILLFNLFSLCGMPFMSGYYSKDLIMEMGVIAAINSFSYSLMIIAMILTSYYTLRLGWYLGGGVSHFSSIMSWGGVSNFFIMLSAMILSTFSFFWFGVLFEYLIIWPHDENLYMSLKVTDVIIFMLIFLFGVSSLLMNFYINPFKNYYFLFQRDMWMLNISTTQMFSMFIMKFSVIYYMFDLIYMEILSSQGFNKVMSNSMNYVENVRRGGYMLVFMWLWLILMWLMVFMYVI